MKTSTHAVIVRCHDQVVVGEEELQFADDDLLPVASSIQHPFNITAGDVFTIRLPRSKPTSQRGRRIKYQVYSPSHSVSILDPKRSRNKQHPALLLLFQSTIAVYATPDKRLVFSDTTGAVLHDVQVVSDVLFVHCSSVVNERSSASLPSLSPSPSPSRTHADRPLTPVPSLHSARTSLVSTAT